MNYTEEQARKIWHDARSKLKSGDCDFSSWEFPIDPDDKSFKDLTFPGIAYFHNSVFEGKQIKPDGSISQTAAYFDNSVFQYMVIFNNTIFEAVAKFPRCIFNGHTNFRECHFKYGADFRESKFNDDVDFSKSNFSKRAYFGECIFSQITDFDKAIITKSNYYKAVFEEETTFDETIFNESTTFWKTTFKDRAYFQNTQFVGSVQFSGAKILDVADFRHAIFHNEAWFDGVEKARNVLIFYPWEKPRPFLKQENGAYAYQIAKISAQNRGDYIRAGHYHYSEQCALNIEQRKKAEWKPWRRSFWEKDHSPFFAWGNFFFGRVLFGYAERPFRVLVAGFFTIFAWSIVYWKYGVISGKSVDGLSLINNDYLTCLYFSIVTFTTLGYGDLKPVESLRLFAASEAIIGAILMALFVVALTRSFTR